MIFYINIFFLLTVKIPELNLIKQQCNTNNNVCILCRSFWVKPELNGNPIYVRCFLETWHCEHIYIYTQVTVNISIWYVLYMADVCLS